MLDETLFMQIRLFRMFREQFNLPSARALAIFNEYGIWQFVEDGYDLFHMQGDQTTLDEIVKVLTYKKALA